MALYGVASRYFFPSVYTIRLCHNKGQVAFWRKPLKKVCRADWTRIPPVLLIGPTRVCYQMSRHCRNKSKKGYCNACFETSKVWRVLHCVSSLSHLVVLPTYAFRAIVTPQRPHVRASLPRSRPTSDPTRAGARSRSRSAADDARPGSAASFPCPRVQTPPSLPRARAPLAPPRPVPALVPAHPRPDRAPRRLTPTLAIAAAPPCAATAPGCRPSGRWSARA